MAGLAQVFKRSSSDLNGSAAAGVRRQVVFAADGTVTSRVLTDGGTVAPWHQHLDHDTVVYVVNGRFDVETADGVTTGVAGDFLHVPRRTVHREINPATTASEVIVVRTGAGPDYEAADAR